MHPMHISEFDLIVLKKSDQLTDQLTSLTNQLSLLEIHIIWYNFLVNSKYSIHINGN